MIYTTRTTCRLCGGLALDPILALGDLAFAAFPAPGDQLDQVPRAPLTFVLCRTCGLAQLRETVAPELLFRQYWYRSTINETMRAELDSVVRAALLQVTVAGGSDLVIDVGANDGYLLSQYPQQRAHWNTLRIAFEPAANLQEACHECCEVLVPDFFPAAVLQPWERRVKVISSIAMFYDLDDPAAFVTAVNRLLHPEGVWIVQFQDLGQMVDATAFDNLCHEHLTYWSLASFQALLATCVVDLHVVQAERRAINGGSLRLTIRRRVHPVQPSVALQRARELGSIDWQALERFAWGTQAIRRQIGAIISQAEGDGRVIDLYGASTKANTLLQYCGLGPRWIRRAWERNPEKVGRRTATGIPIVSEEAGRVEPPDLLLVGIWQFREAVIAREAGYLDGGGALLFPLPEVDVLQKETRDAAADPV